MQRRRTEGYVRKIEFVFYNEEKIRVAVMDARNLPQIPGKNGSQIGDPTASRAIRNVTPLRRVSIHGEYLEWPEAWLEVVEATYKWCDYDRLIVAKDRYSGIDYRETCAKLSISNTTRRRLLMDIQHYASLCAAQAGLIRLF